jgi:hypothetical protein
MSCCQPPLGLAYLRGLLGRRQDISVFPPDALEKDEPPDSIYFYRPNEILVPSSQVEAFEAAARRIGIRVCRCGDSGPGKQGDGRDRDRIERAARWHPSREIARFVVGARDELDSVLDRLQRADRALRVTPNHVLFGCPEWGFNPSGEPLTWQDADALPLGAADPLGVSVAVIDSGLPTDRTTNPVLAPVELPSGVEEPWPYRADWPVLTFPEGHGSFVSGVVRMTAPGATVSSYRALDEDGVTDEWSLAEQIALAISDEPQVINLSLGTTTRHDESLMGLAALQQAALVGSRPIVVASAGNLATDRPFYPAAEEWVIGVAAVEMTGDPAIPVPASFTNYGNWVDAGADGVNVISAYEAHPYRPITPPAAIEHFKGAARWSGTSFAAPKVSAVVALLRAEDPGIDRGGVLTTLAEGAAVLPGLGVLVL